MEYPEFCEQVKRWLISNLAEDISVETGESEAESGTITDLLEAVRVGDGCFEVAALEMPAMYAFYKEEDWNGAVMRMRQLMRKNGMLRRRHLTTLQCLELLDEEGKELFERLRHLRAELAREGHVPPYIIFSNDALLGMTEQKPENEEQMLLIRGIGEKTYAAYGEQILDEIDSWRCTSQQS